MSRNCTKFRIINGWTNHVNGFEIGKSFSFEYIVELLSRIQVANDKYSLWYKYTDWLQYLFFLQVIRSAGFKSLSENYVTVLMLMLIVKLILTKN